MQPYVVQVADLKMFIWLLQKHDTTGMWPSQRHFTQNCCDNFTIILKLVQNRFGAALAVLEGYKVTTTERSLSARG